jgi:hypothetical protein
MEQSLASATAYAYTVKGTKAVSGTEALDELIHTGTSDGTAGAKSRSIASARKLMRSSPATSCTTTCSSIRHRPRRRAASTLSTAPGIRCSARPLSMTRTASRRLVPTDANALGQWYHRKFVLTSIAGNTINGWASTLNGVTAGKYKAPTRT